MTGNHRPTRSGLLLNRRSMPFPDEPHHLAGCTSNRLTLYRA